MDIKGKVFQKFFADFFKGTAGQYFTPLNIVRFMVECFDIRQDDLVLDPSCGSGGFLLQTLQYMQEKSKKLDGEYNQKRFWHSFAEKNLYGIEISGGISQTAKMNMIIHDDGHTNVITADGLDSFENFIKRIINFKKTPFISSLQIHLLALAYPQVSLILRTFLLQKVRCISLIKSLIKNPLKI